MKFATTLFVLAAACLALSAPILDTGTTLIDTGTTLVVCNYDLRMLIKKLICVRWQETEREDGELSYLIKYSDF